MAEDISEAWQELIEEFQAHLIQSNRMPRTLEVRMAYVNNFARGRTDTPADIEPRHVLKFIGRPDWSSSTRRVAQDGLVAFFRFAKKFNYIEKDPTAVLKPIKQEVNKTEPATREQINAALKIADARTRLMLRLTADAGLSALEISQARPRDVFEIGGDHYLHVFGKAGAERDVYLLPDLATEIQAKTTDYVFPGRPEPHLDAAYISRLISKPLPDGVSSESVRAAFRTGGRSNTPRGWRDGEPFHSPDALGFMENPDLSDSPALQLQIKRLSRDLDRDPAAAIGACKELLETVFKAVLDAKGIPHSQPGHIENFPDLFTKAADALGIRETTFSDNDEANEGASWLWDGLLLVVRGIGRIRNKVGTGHGHGVSPAEIRHARLIFNATVALTEYISETWQSEEPF